MGASSSGLLDEAKISNIKGLVDSTFQSFSVFYCQQYSAAYIEHLHQEVEPKNESRNLLLTKGPQYAPEEVLYRGSVKFSCWDEQGRKSKEKYTVLRRNYEVEIHENIETFSHGGAAKLVLQTAGGSVFSTEEESKTHLEHTCAGILHGVKEDSSYVVSSDMLAVYLHLPYMGRSCFLFQQEEERDNFLSALKTCIRHSDLDPWCDSSYESQAYVRALQLYRQDKECYESWEMLLGTEEQVLAYQVMEEVLPWLQCQLQSRVKGKKTERMQQWLATSQATYMLVLEQLTASLEALREECRQNASANQAQIRSNLDQIMSSHCFLEEKVRACISVEAEKVCSESVAPFMSCILEALTENISAGIQGMQHTLHTQMDSAFSHIKGGTEETKKALSPLHSISLDQCYRQVENLTEKLEDLKQHFGLSSNKKLVHSAHLEMEKLLDSAVYTLELFLQSSARLQPSQNLVKMERAKERVLKQLDYDCRVVQRRLYQEVLLELTLPALTRKMDSKWKSELRQFEQYIFSDYSTFILVENVYDDVLRNILSKEIETVVQDAASKKNSSLLLDTSDLAISQYSLLGQTPPRSAPSSPASAARDSSSATPREGKEQAPVGEEEGQTVTAEVSPHSDPDLNPKSDHSISQSCDQSAGLPSPVIVVTQQFDESATEEASCCEETREDVHLGTDTPSTTESTTAEPSNSATPDPDAALTYEVDAPDVPANPDPTNPIPDSPELSASTPSLLQSTDVPGECAQSDQSATPKTSATPELLTSDRATEDLSHSPCTDVQISLGSLSKVIDCNGEEPSMTQTMTQHTTDRAVYLTGEIKDNWDVERGKEEKQKEAAEEKEIHEQTKDGNGETQTGGKEEDIEEVEGAACNKSCQSCESPAESTTALTTEQKESEKKGDDEEEKDSGLGTERGKEDEEEEAEEKEDHEEKEGKKEEEEALQSHQPMELQPESAAELPLDSVAIIRDLVVEITEVETEVGPCPTSSHGP